MSNALISYDPRGCYLPEHGITPDDLAKLAGPLDEARDETQADAQLWADAVEVSPPKQPLDAGFHELPDRLLGEFRTHGAKSEVGQIQAAADRLSAAVGSVVVLGIGGSYMGARALLEALRHAYYNDAPAATRGGRPRIYFEGNNVDNGALVDLMELLRSRDEKWGIVVISKSGGTLETAAAFRILLRELKDSLSRQAAGKSVGEFVIPVTGTSGKLFELAKALKCPELFDVPDGVGGRFSILSAVGLVPAAVMGLDVVRLLEGASAMNEHFRNKGPADNIVLQYVGVCHLMESMRGCATRILSTWGKRLEAVGLWYDQLLAESLGKEERGALPLTVVNTRDLHSRGQQHQEGKRDKLITNLVIDAAPKGPVKIGASDLNQDGLNELADKTIADVLRAATAGTNQAYLEANRPTADLHLPQLDEFALGQFFQMMMLATVVEGRLIGVNPFGQPGVEAYKKNMNAILRGK
jgi:glucose-6-phosphate isomerase